jgi:predicted ribosomally synthesized peptide with nif11-like leader
MSQADAVAFVERVESDEEFAKELESIRQDPSAVVERVHAAGFDATPEEIREAFIDRYGAELTPEQLDKIAAGYSPEEIGAMVGGSVLLVGVTGALAAVAAGI